MAIDLIQTLPVSTGLTLPPGGAPLVLAQSAFVLVSWWKVLILLLPFLLWGKLVSDVFDKHADRFHLPNQLHNLWEQ